MLAVEFQLCQNDRHYTSVSMSDALISVSIVPGAASLSFNTLSITDSSVAVVSKPANAAQSLATSPPPITALPRFTVPATSGTWRREESSSRSSTDVWGCTWRGGRSRGGMQQMIRTEERNELVRMCAGEPGQEREETVMQRAGD